ncbi:LuxR C-terminal-related transcriptional regulator [Adlercreutzia equolifaciens]|uniref:LuxR C-terminal-related transcriptional regulator n=1 Tax=Adlercreutzia equolifaciens TaxID=446660 RepID=UPI0023B14F9A|nr:LuxR C-terminal-related transcriptional regulator [Adlercreutzia equolifaciens]MDE8702995.1 LuxR C-terminal-related transcriptional regulator [Adlercreutzia equolifaciens]
MRERDSEAAGRGRSFLLLPSKITCPRPEQGVVVRSRVREKLELSKTRPVTTVTAPAGFGKTTAVAAWADALALPVAWCALDEDDGDPARFWYAVSRALARADERLDGLRNLAEVGWAQAVEAREALTELLVHLASFPEPAVLILEDVHAVQDAPVVGDTLAFFLRNLPPHIHMVLTSRTPVRIPLAKMRVRGDLVEIDQDDLRLSAHEQAKLFREASLALSREDEALLEEATQGWPAGCRLLEMRCRRSSASEITEIMRQARASVSDYLFEEVLEDVPAELLRFMTETAVVESFSAPLAARITGLTEAEVRRRVDQLIDAGLFVQRLEREEGDPWYRYHAMLQEVLHVRLHRMEEDDLRTLVDRARAWLLDEGFDDAAVGLSYWMRDYEAICAIVEQRWKSLYMNDELEVVLRWIDLLPPGLLEAHPFLCAVAALPTVYAGNALRAHELIQQALLRLEEGDDFLFAFCMVQKAYLSSFEGKQAESAQFAEKALRFLPDEERYLRGMMMQVAASALWAADPLAAIAGYTQALPLQRTVGNVNLLASALCNLAVFQAAVGHLNAAEQLAREAFELYPPEVRSCKPMLSFAWRALAEVAYDRGDETAFAEACEHFESLASHGSVAARQAELLVLRAKQAAQRSASEARALFGRAFALEESAALSMMPTLALVRDWCAERQVPTGEGLQGADCSGRLAWFCLAVRLVRGEDIAEEAPAFAEGVSADDAALKVRACVLAAVAAERAGRVQGALSLVREAFSVARFYGLMGAFAENAADMQPLAALLRAETAKSERGGGKAEAADDRAALQVLEDALRGGRRAADVLTDRELDVLRAVADGASVAQAAELLVVSRETVKKHLGNIYTKLGVHSKMAAVALLREEGVL